MTELSENPPAPRHLVLVVEPSLAPPQSPNFELEDEEEEVTLATLTRDLGPATHDELSLALGPHPDGTLERRGAAIDARKVMRETLFVALQVEEFLGGAKAAQREGVRVSRDLLRILVWTGASCAKAYARWRARIVPRFTPKEAARRSAAAQQGAKASLAQLAGALRTVLTGEAAELARVDAAVKSVGADGRAGKALVALVAVARDAIASEDAGVVARRGLYNLSASYVDRCETAADEARSDDRGELSPTDSKAERKSALDAWCGATFLLLERVVLAFEHARAADPRVPKLRLRGLRDLLLRTITPPPAPKVAKVAKKRRTRRRRRY
jgi:hypothetical protein